MKAAVVSLLYLALLVPAFGQEVLENTPPRIKWYQVKTPNFRVLYPKGFEQQAMRMANTLEHIRGPEAKSLGRPSRKFSVLLQNQTAIANGFVSLTPRRSEFFTMPPQDVSFSGTTDWLSQLAAHEYRHMVQFDRSRTGLNKAIYYIFGPATMAGMAQAAAPTWFWEGDAVGVETSFTPSGRGRIPNFGLVLRTNLLEGREFNYHKQYLRSYKHFIPDHYVLGYHMVGYLRKRTNDPLIWDKVTQRSWKVPFIPFAFSSALKKETGLYVTDLYREMVKDLQQDWRAEISTASITSFDRVGTSPRKGYTDYKYPQAMGGDKVIALKRGIGDIDRFVFLSEGGEQRIFVPGIVNDNGMLSAAGNKIVWNEYMFDPRWRRKNYSVVKVYDFSTKVLSQIGQRTRYSGVALSPDANRVVVIESTTGYEVNVQVLDLNGNLVKTLATSAGDVLFAMPRWSADGKSVVVLKTHKFKRSVVVYDVKTGSERELVPARDENIGHPVLIGNWLLVNSPVSGIDNIYAFHLETGERFQVTSSTYGAYNPSVSADGEWLYYNEQTRDGFDVVRVPFKADQWRLFTPLPQPKSYFQYMVEQEGAPTLFDSIPADRFVSKKYHKAAGILNPYSWGVFFNTSLTQADIGIVSQDVLSTTQLKLGYVYDINERVGSWRAGVSYQNWFPVIDAEVRFSDRSTNEGDIVYGEIVGSDTIAVTDNLTFTWKERTLEAGVRLPLLTTRSKYFGNFTVGNYVGYTHTEDFQNSITGSGRLITPQLPVYWDFTIIDNGDLLFNHFFMNGYRLLKRSRRDINSAWGQTFTLHYYNTPYGGDYTGKQFSFYTQLYFPGVARHHSLWGYWGVQQTEIELLTRSSAAEPYEDNGSYFFPNQVPLPRGLPIARFEKFYTMSANYTLPLWYPDAALGPLLNIQRVRANAFLDYGFGTSQFGDNPAFSETYVSVGAELKVDVNILRFLPQFDLGVRFSYGLQPSVTTFEFLLGTINF